MTVLFAYPPVVLHPLAHRPDPPHASGAVLGKTGQGQGTHHA